MVVTRSARTQDKVHVTSDGSFPQKVGDAKSTRFSPPRLSAAREAAQMSSVAEGIQEHPVSKKKSGSDDQSTAESQSSEKQNTSSRTPKFRKRKNRGKGSLAEITEPSTDGETSEAESNCSSISETQEPILRITRRRQIIIAPTPAPTVRKRQKMTPIIESVTEVVSEAESHVSGISRIVSSPEVTRTKNKARSQRGLSQESSAETVSDAESSCSDISFSGIIHKRTTRILPRKSQAQTGNKGTEIVSEDEERLVDMSVNSEEPNSRQTYIGEEQEANVASLKEARKQNCKSLDEEDDKIVDERKENDKSCKLKSLPKLQDTSLQHLVSQKLSTPQNNKTASEPSDLNREAVLKSLAQTFAVVEVDRCNGGRKSAIKTSDLTKVSDLGGSDWGEEAAKKVNEDMNSEKSIALEHDARSELNTCQDVDDVLLVLSSDESQQSENSESEEDIVCFVENGGQKESVSGNAGNTSCDNALFVIDTTPGLSADKNFYLEDKASEIATEEEKEREEDENSEESSDSDKNKDEFSDEEDLLSNTKSKLLKLTSSSIDPGLSIKELGGLYINFNAEKLQPNKRILTQIKEKKKNELLQKTVITPDFEKKYCVPPYNETKHQLQKKRRKERQKTAGDGWFGMKAPELTDELKNDLKALKMRASMDPKRFYKKNDRDGFPKYFQIGTIVDNPADFYHSRIPKKERKRTIVEELLADSEFRRYNRRKYSEIMAEKAANAAGKKFRKKKKFRN
ncbi:deoxynucleotidyltransferase terminal-interacting protein 2 [Ctenodactylus gundi]